MGVMFATYWGLAGNNRIYDVRIGIILSSSLLIPSKVRATTANTILEHLYPGSDPDLSNDSSNQTLSYSHNHSNHSL